MPLFQEEINNSHSVTGLLAITRSYIPFIWIALNDLALIHILKFLQEVNWNSHSATVAYKAIRDYHTLIRLVLKGLGLVNVSKFLQEVIFNSHSATVVYNTIKDYHTIISITLNWYIPWHSCRKWSAIPILPLLYIILSHITT